MKEKMKLVYRKNKEEIHEEIDLKRTDEGDTRFLFNQLNFIDQRNNEIMDIMEKIKKIERQETDKRTFIVNDEEYDLDNIFDIVDKVDHIAWNLWRSINNMRIWFGLKEVDILHFTVGEKSLREFNMWIDEEKDKDIIFKYKKILSM